MAISDTLQVNAELKYIEFILGLIDKSDDSMSVGDIRKKFEEKFSHKYTCRLNQYFGIVRLIPLMHIVEDTQLNNTDDGERIVVIRNAFAHNDFSADENGYHFRSNRQNRQDVHLSYDEFVEFLHRIENAFYSTHHRFKK